MVQEETGNACKGEERGAAWFILVFFLGGEGKYWEKKEEKGK